MPLHLTQSDIGQLEQILQKLHLQQDTLDDMLRENNALSMRFGEVLVNTIQLSL